MHHFENIQIKPSACAYYMFIFLLVINDGLGNSVIPNYNDGPIQQFLLLCELGFAVFCLFFQCHNKQSLIFFGAIFGIGCAAYLFGGRTGLLLTLLAAALGRSAQVDTLLKMVFWEKLLVFLLIVGLSLIGKLPGREALLEMTNATEKGVTLGYAHANTFSATVVIILLLFTSINRSRLSIVKLGLIGAVELVNYAITRSRIGFIVIFFLIVAVICVRNVQLKRLALGVSKFFLFFILILNTIFVLLRMFGDNDLLSAIDINIFNGRMGFSAMYLQTYPLSLFGTELDETLIAAKSWYYALDNGYTIILLYYGIAGLIIFLLTYQRTVLALARSKQVVLSLIAMCFIIWMMFEGITLTATGNFIFLLLGKEIPCAEPKHRCLAW